ncbi:MAG: 1,4-dihydroxy-2-naphthoate polyprenyltransferase [Anaerolineales bacterium]|nr:1,4-dihydroxy-2-naphthoate polyprenyltransferase [Anaerolineales bacterium]
MNQSVPFSTWMQAARPRTLPAAAAPVLVATALAWRDGVFHPWAALTCLLISLLLQIGANFANDLFDHERGADTPDRLGPPRVTATGQVSPAQMRLALGVVFGVAVLLGLYLITLRGWPVLVLGGALIVAALAYTGGPFPYGYNALGDLFVFLSFGVAAVCGTYYVQAGTVTPTAWWASVPMGLLIVNILVVNNTRDIPTDARTKKRTLAVLLGARAMRFEYLVCLVGAYLVPPALWGWGLASPGVLLTWFSLPRAVVLYREFSETEGRALNQTLARTAQLALLYAGLFSVGSLLP